MPTSTLDYIHTLVKYHNALNDRLWESITHLTDDQFVQDVDFSHGSVHNQIVHMALWNTRWLRGLQGDSNARQFDLNPDNYSDREGAKKLWDSMGKDFADYVASLDEANLDDQIQGMSGPTWQVLAHLVNHGTDHRAQILRLLHDFGAPTFDQDLIIHLWYR